MEVEWRNYLGECSVCPNDDNGSYADHPSPSQLVVVRWEGQDANGNDWKDSAIGLSAFGSVHPMPGSATVLTNFSRRPGNLQGIEYMAARVSILLARHRAWLRRRRGEQTSNLDAEVGAGAAHGHALTDVYNNAHGVDDVPRLVPPRAGPPRTPTLQAHMEGTSGGADGDTGEDMTPRALTPEQCVADDAADNIDPRATTPRGYADNDDDDDGGGDARSRATTPVEDAVNVDDDTTYRYYQFAERLLDDSHRWNNFSTTPRVSSLDPSPLELYVARRSPIEATPEPVAPSSEVDDSWASKYLVMSPQP